MTDRLTMGVGAFYPYMRETPFSDHLPLHRAKLLKPKRVVKRRRAKSRKSL
jgi:hypothetical protein